MDTIFWIQCFGCGDTRMRYHGCVKYGYEVASLFLGKEKEEDFGFWICVLCHDISGETKVLDITVDSRSHTASRKVSNSRNSEVSFVGPLVKTHLWQDSHCHGNRLSLVRIPRVLPVEGHSTAVVIEH